MSRLFAKCSSSNCNNGRSIEEIPHPYKTVFSEFSNFNAIQSKVIDDVLHTDDSLVVCAPTGSGKTVIFELAIIRLLISLEHTQYGTPFKIVYICPMRALCEERLIDWHKKFSNFGINAIAVTGDSENVEFKNLLNHNLIITTPEKWDCLTRKWRENLRLVQMIKLFMIDEIHLLNEDARGSTLETIVCRMKTIQNAGYFEKINDCSVDIRYVALSATIPNVEDIAQWLSEKTKCYKFSHEYRPVKLNTIVMGYPHHPNTTPFRFDMSLTYKLHPLIMQYSHGKPTLIFCGTRKIVEMTAKHILDNLTFNLKPGQLKCLVDASEALTDPKVKSSLIHGVGYHHAGMLSRTRRIVENLFRNGDLPILVTTSTLAMGVNLPAHLVIIKSTKVYSNREYKDYTETTLLQMVGRAGRPQFDNEATVIIMTSAHDKEKFEKMLGGHEPIESALHKHLIEHLNAEVVLETITDFNVAIRWLSLTFLYIRARKNPRFYGITSSDPSSIDRRLSEMCQIELNKLIKAGMLTIDQDVLLKPTPVGAAMAKYYLTFETMKLFTQVTGGEIIQQILGVISKCFEFSGMYLRVNDKKSLNLLNKCHTGQTIRFPLNGKIKTLDMKINCIIQAVLGCLDIEDHSLLSEALNIMRSGERIVKCLLEYLESREKCFQALLSTIILSKCFIAKLWENSPYVSKQLPGIGSVLSSNLAYAGKTSFQLISECDPRVLEMIMGKKPPFGDKMLKQIYHLPKYCLTLERFGKTKAKLSVSLDNALDLEQTCTVNRNSTMYLLVGNASNDILLYEKYSHAYLIGTPNIIKFIDIPENSDDDISVHFISQDWVGIDAFTKLELVQKPESTVQIIKTPKSAKKNKKTNDMKYMQTFMKTYLKVQEEKEGKSVRHNADLGEHGNKKQIIIHSNVKINENEDTFANTMPYKEDNKNYMNNHEQRPKEIEQIKQKHQFTPRKQINKRPLGSPRTFAEPLVKKLTTEDKLKSQTKITWRSPLTYSPQVKFSPKINYNCLNSDSGETDGMSSSHASSSHSLNPQKNHGNLNKTSASSSSVKSSFPLSDKAFLDSSMEVLEKFGDIVSTSFLEECGLISSKSQNTEIKTPNEYYHHLLSQLPKKDNVFDRRIESGSCDPVTKNRSKSDFFNVSHQSFSASEHSDKFSTKNQTAEKCDTFKQIVIPSSHSKNLPNKYCNKSPYFNQSLTGSGLRIVSAETLKNPPELIRHQKSIPGSLNRQLSSQSQHSFKKGKEKTSETAWMTDLDHFENISPIQRNISNKVLNKLSEEDIFNDSVDSMLNDLSLPRDIKSTYSMSRTGSFSGVDFEDNTLKDVLMKQQPFCDANLMNVSPSISTNKYITDEGPSPLVSPQENAFNQNIEYPYLNYEPNPHRESFVPSEWNYQRRNYQTQPLPALPRYNYEESTPDFNRTPHFYTQNANFQENIYSKPPVYRPGYYAPNTNMFSCVHSDSDYNEGYCYLRRSMEKENDPFMFDDSRFISDVPNTFNHIPEKRVYSERPFSNMSNFTPRFHEADKVYRRISLPYSGQPTKIPQMQPTSQYEQNRFCNPSQPMYGSDKDYLMERFFADIGGNQTAPSRFYR